MFDIIVAVIFLYHISDLNAGFCRMPVISQNDTLIIFLGTKSAIGIKLGNRYFNDDAVVDLGDVKGHTNNYITDC